MTPRMTWILIGAVLASAVAGCSGERDPGDLLGPGEAGTIVVEARLIVGETFPTVLLHKTLSPDRPYHRDEAALPGARVWIIGPAADTVFYYEDTGSPRADRYVPGPDSSGIPVVNARTHYRLEVRAADGIRPTISLSRIETP